MSREQVGANQVIVGLRKLTWTGFRCGERRIGGTSLSEPLVVITGSFLTQRAGVTNIPSSQRVASLFGREGWPKSPMSVPIAEAWR